jgi:pimeloyl-ACP methyl ester carboxylesterase
MKRFSWFFAIVLVGLLTPLLAQAQPTPPVSTITAQPTSTAAPEQLAPEPDVTLDETTAAAERYQPGKIDWKPCAENAELECGTLRLPVDYKQPRGETFDMAVVRAKTTEPSKRIGVLFTNPGGPGISGVDQVVFGINAPLFALARTRFDIIGFDPRGVGRSRPIQCAPGSIDLPENGDDAALAAALDEFSRAYAEDCLRQDGPFVTKVSTNNVARDMDMLRRALGERKITYASGSYGTQLGAVYASLFPHRLRAMALDAGIAPVFRDFYVESTANQLAAFEMELQRVDVLCRRDAACRLREQGVVAALDQLMAKLNAEPFTTPDGVVITGNSARSVVYTLLYRESAAPLIVDVLANGLDGDYTLISRLLPSVDAGLSLGALYAIRCNDYGTRRQAAEYLPVDEVIGARNSRFFGRFYLAYRLATCAAFPAADPPIIRNIQHKVDAPLLLIMNDFDPATPPAEMRSLAFALGMERTVVRYQGGGHTFPKNNACVGNIFVSYLFDLKLPAEGATCPGQPISFAPRAQANSAQALETTDGLWGFVEPLQAP